MSVGTFQQPDFETQSGTQYKSNIDNCVEVVGQIGDQFAPHEASTPNMTVKVDAGRLFVDGSLVLRSQQTSATITAPSNNPRIDRIVMSETTGVISVVTGTEGSSPSPPAVPSGTLPICQIALSVGQQTITNSHLTDERSWLIKPSPALNQIPIGALLDWPGPNTPTGWLLCYGQAVSRTTYAALFAALGTTWGAGDGSTTFNLPDFRGRVGAGKDNMGGTAANRLSIGATLGAAGGAQSHQLTANELPGHSHPLNKVTNNPLELPEAPYLQPWDGVTGPITGLAPAATGNTGNNYAHNNVQPTAIVNKIIFTGVV
ncbi:MAG: tail fiber protein [Candidatus Thermoplasmatota archaeon]|nr:tail fiber protein [Candidatus Thermoplasmatota archaeon]